MTTEFIEFECEEEWLELRSRDITSTESSALFCMSPYETNFELWHRKRVGGGTNIDFDNERMQAGRHIEPAIASLVSERYGVQVRPMKKYARDNDARMGASFDFEVFGVTDDTIADTSLRELFNNLGNGILECKNVDGLIFKNRWSTDEAPDHIEIQLQHQLSIAGHKWGCTAALVGGNSVRIYAREKDDAVGNAIRSRVKRFWASIAANEEPAPVMPDDANAIIEFHKAAGGDVFDATEDSDVSGLIALYDYHCSKEKAAAEGKKTARAMILMAVGEADRCIWKGGKLTLTEVKRNKGKEITQDMVGTFIGEREGYRNFRSYPAKVKQDE